MPARLAAAVRLQCAACGATQPADRRATDRCVACGGEVRAESRCPWCLAFGPAAKYCRGCGAEQPPGEHFGAARMLKAGGVDRFGIAGRLRDMPADYVEDLGRRFAARWGIARAVLERLDAALSYAERPAAWREAATLRWLEALPLEGPEPEGPPPLGAVPPSPRDPSALHGPERAAAIAALQAVRTGCDDPDVRAATVVGLIRLSALDPDALQHLRAAPLGAGAAGDEIALAAGRLWLLPAYWPRFDAFYDMAVGKWMDGVGRMLGERYTALRSAPEPRVAALASVFRVAMRDRDPALRKTVEGLLTAADRDVRALAALALARRGEARPPALQRALLDAGGTVPGPVALAVADGFLEAKECPPEVRACLTTCLSADEPALILEGLQRVRHRKAPPGGFSDLLAALLDPRHDPQVRVAAAGAIASAPDPTPEALRALEALTALPPKGDDDAEKLAAEATRALGEHVDRWPRAIGVILGLVGRARGSQNMMVESRIQDWSRDGKLTAEALVATWDEPDPARRRAVLGMGRTRARSGAADAGLYAASLRVSLKDADAQCRNVAHWIMHDLWSDDRSLKDGPVDLALATRAMGEPLALWRCVADLCRTGAARECQEGEHLQWVADATAPDLVAALAAAPDLAAEVAEALLSAAGDNEVRIYPRTSFVKLLGGIGVAVLAVKDTILERLDAVSAGGPIYDLKYWVDRMRRKLRGQPEVE